jgi:nucleoside-diphosphate-sugar epimerase
MASEERSSSSKITVLGGRGFIGSHLVRNLQAAGYECYVPHKGDDSLWTAVLGHVIYAIGLTADFRSRPLDTVESHVCVLERLLRTANFQSLTYLSSTRVYGSGKDTSEAADLQINPNNPDDLYNLSKLAGESLCLHCGRQGMKVARLSNVVGQRKDANIFLDQLLEEGLETGKVVLRSSLESMKDYVYIDDAVALLADLSLSTRTGIYNVAGGEGIRNREIAETLREEMGFEVSVAPDAVSLEFNPVDISKAKSQFGFSPRRFGDYFPTFLGDYRKRKGL